jgi:hypothetical protein
MRGIGRAFAAIIVIGSLVVFGFEAWHRWNFGHFVGYGLHTDVYLSNSDAGTNDMYFAKLWNLTVSPIELVGCADPSDVGGVPDSVFYRWDVQKRESSGGQWVSLHGSNNWLKTPFDESWKKEEPCQTVRTTLLPFHSINKAAWVFKDWVTTGEPVRMAIHTSVIQPTESQKIIYTDTFVVERPMR